MNTFPETIIHKEEFQIFCRNKTMAARYINPAHNLFHINCYQIIIRLFIVMKKNNVFKSKSTLFQLPTEEYSHLNSDDLHLVHFIYF